MHYTNKWVNCVVRYLNMKKTENWLEKLMQIFEIQSIQSECRKGGIIGIKQVSVHFLRHLFKPYWLEKREGTFSGSNYYMGILVDEMTNSLNLRTWGVSIKKNNARTTNTDIFTLDFMELLEQFKGLPYLGYRNRHIHQSLTQD